MHRYILLTIEEKFIINILFKNKIINNDVFEQLNYDKVVKIASSHLMLPALYFKLKKRNYLKKIPNELVNYLKCIYEINKERNLILCEEMYELSKILDSKNIKYLFIKGSAHIKNKIYEDIGVRMIGDIDILMKKSDAKRIYKLLKVKGYKNNKPETFYWKKKHKPKLINKDKIFPIEIHSEVLLYRFRKLLTGNEILNSNILKIKEKSLKLSILNFQINDYGFLKGLYSFRTIYDYQILSNYNKLTLNNYIKKFFLITNDLGITSHDIKMGFFDKLFMNRLKFKKRYFLFYKIDNFICLIIKLIPIRFLQVIEFLFNREYREYIVKKI